jgi:ribosomal protein L9
VLLPLLLLLLLLLPLLLLLQVILLNDIEKLGKQGELLTVPIGYWRNFLLPTGKAKVANAQILE